MFMLQTKVQRNREENNELVSREQLTLTDGFDARLRGKCIYFAKRVSGAIERDTRTPEMDMYFGEVSSNVLECFHYTLQSVFGPQLENMQSAWGKCSDVHSKEFLAHLNRFDEMVGDAVSSLQGGIELRKPDKIFLLENKQHAYQRAASDPDVLIVYENVMEEWCSQCEKLLLESDQQDDPDDTSGPSTEFEFWRNRMAKFNSVAEQLKQRESKCVIGVVGQSKSKVMKKWKAIDNQITDSLNEAKDNVKYLSALEKYTEPLYTGTPATIIESLPALMNNTKMMLTIARYYGTSSRMTTLFTKLTNQIITNCKNSIMRPDKGGPAMKLWDQDIANLLDRLKVIVKLHDIYLGLYKATKEKLAALPKGKQFDFNESAIFGKFDLLCKRVQKLHDMFTTVHQFTSLADHEVEGMESLIQRFFDILSDLKRKPYDMLDFTKNAFDRDYLEYNVNIAELELQVQNFINMSFENILSTEQALTLLKTFESILVRDSLKADLDSKYTVIFQNYGMDLETVQRLYEKQKAQPPMMRNAAPVTGNILWAKLLLRRIEDPMRRFKAHSSLMQNSKDAKKIVKMYNKVARALIEFETLWHNAWTKSIEAARSGLQATLIVRHPRTHKLFVNFDREILQLIREAKTLQRAHVEIPQGARMVLHQEDKFKSYYNQLSFALKEYERVIDLVPPVVKDLFTPHFKDLEGKIEPGMVLLTWQSMNIDSYLQRIHSGLIKFEELVRKVCDILENRVEGNLKAISKTLLVELPSDQSFTLEQFVMLQEKTTKQKTAMLDSKNQEVERSINDVIHLLKTFQLETPTPVPADAIEALWVHYSKLMYLSVLRCTKQSFFSLKNRLKGQGSSGFLYIDRPFFDVDIELSLPLVTMNPSLDEIQAAINRCALNILRCSKSIYQWAKGNGIRDRSQRQPYHHMIGQDYQIVAVCLILTGAVEGTKKQVHDYLLTFMQYDYLWKDDKREAYEQLMASNPDLDHIDQELQKYSDIEDSINRIPPVHNIGCLSLETGPLKNSLRTEATMWKTQYNANIHKEALSELNEVLSYMGELEKRLDQDLEELDDVRQMMMLIREVRDKEVEIDVVMSPIEQKYSLLLKYDAVIDPDELVLVTEWRENWNKVVSKARVASEELNKRQEAFRTELVRNVTNFTGDVKLFRKEFVLNGPVEQGIAPIEAANRMHKFEELFREMEVKWRAYSEGEALFGLQITEFPELEVTKKELDLLGRLYSLYINVLQSTKAYKDLPWSDTSDNIEDMLSTVNVYLEKCRKMPKQLREWEAYAELKKNVEDFLEVLPLLQMLCSSAMRNRHWVGIQAVAGTSLDITSKELLLGDVLNMCLKLNPDDVEEICNSAVKELEIESTLKALREDWAETRFEFQNFKSKGPVLLRAAELQDILDKLEESSVVLSQMANNKHSAPFREDVTQCSVELASVSEVIELWTVVQSSWVYMEAVFLAGDIAKQLPQEAKRFAGIDKSYMQLTAKAFEAPSVIHCCHRSEQMKSMLPHLAEQLELCQRSLKGYLESKRAFFPRFYFISDNSLLEILSFGTDASMVAGHFRHMFDSLSNVGFDKARKDLIVSMSSAEGERVMLTRPLEIKGTVEEYMNDVVSAMQSTLKDVSRDCVAELGSLNIDKFVKMFPSQTCILGLIILWTDTLSESIYKAKSDRNAVPMAVKKAGVLLQGLVSIAAKPMASKIARTNLEALIVTQVHLVDTAQDLQTNKVRTIHDFEWQKQLRCYIDSSKEDDFTTNICDVSMSHSFEFLGCKDRIVITPMTSRCWVALTQTVSMFLGFSAVGPPGTGKSETIKEFGRCISKYVVIFNSSDQMDHVSLGKIFKGIAIGGMWGCFDEFNRISLDVLSVSSQQLQCVFSALRDRRKEFVYTDGQQTALHKDAGYLVTLNAGQGRSELPESLKMLFRSMACILPDTNLILRVKLASMGSLEASTIAKKVVAVLSAAREQLVHAPHYDFGLRTITEILRVFARLKHERPAPKEPPADYEVNMVLSVVRDLTIPRLLPEDVPILLSILDDVVMGSGIIPDTPEDANVKHALGAAARSLHLVHGEDESFEWDVKLKQCYDTVSARHGIAMIGPSLVGKTAMLDTVGAALTALGAERGAPKHAAVRINPKTLTPAQMFGFLDQSTGDWAEGTFVALWRKALRASNVVTWLVLDGPVDVVWAENLNAVLDETKYLTIANGDRWPVTDRIKVVFETGHLINASPSTVSRTGIVHVGAHVLAWKTVANVWLMGRKDKVAVILKDIMFRLVTGALEAVSKQSPLAAHYSTISLVMNMLSLLAILLKPLEASKLPPRSDDVERLLVFAIFWSMTSMLERDQRIRFEADLRRYTAVVPAADAGGLAENFVNKDGHWANFKTTVTRWQHPTDRTPNVGRIVVPTLDNTAASMLMSTLSMADIPMLLTGHAGVSKTSTALHFLNTLPAVNYSVKRLVMSSATDVRQVRSGISSCIEKRQARTYAPPDGKTCYLLIDDMCACSQNRFGDQEALELLRQLVSTGGYFNPSKAGEWRSVMGMRWIATQRHANKGMSRRALSDRVTSLFFPINICMPTHSAVDAIFGQVLRGHLAGVPGLDFGKDVGKLVDATQNVCARLTSKLLPTPVKMHYSFGMNQISRVVQGIVMCNPDSIESREILIRLWCHECERVFTDSLSNHDDKEWSHQTIGHVVEETFGPKVAKAVRDTAYFVNFMADRPEEEFVGAGLVDANDSHVGEASGEHGIDGEPADEQYGADVASLTSLGDTDVDSLSRGQSKGGTRRGSMKSMGSRPTSMKRLQSVSSSVGIVSPRSTNKLENIGRLPSGKSQVSSPASNSRPATSASAKIGMSLTPRVGTGTTPRDVIIDEDGEDGTSPPVGPDVMAVTPSSPYDEGSSRRYFDGGSTGGQQLPTEVQEDEQEQEPQPLNVLYSYEYCSSSEELRARIEDFVIQHDSAASKAKRGPLGLVMFDMAVEQLVMISRAISLDGGSCLLAGLGGGGRNSLARLAAYIAGHETMTLARNEGSGAGRWIEDLRVAVRACVSGQNSVTVIINNADAREDSLYDCINQIIVTGEATDLFTSQELEALAAEALSRQDSLEHGLGQDSPHSSLAASIVLSRLHFVICFSIMSSTLAKTAFKFPGLQNQCQTIYLLPWTPDALEAFAESKLIEMDPTVSDTIDVISKHMSHVYGAVNVMFTKEREEDGRYIYATPRSFAAYVEQFTSVFNKVNNDANSLSESILIGLQKLEDATQDIEDMKVEIAESDVVLMEAQRASGDMLKKISGLSASADKKRSEMQIHKDALDAEQQRVQEDKEAIEQVLVAAAPDVSSAIESLREVSAKDIATIKSLKSPPAVVKVLMDVVLILMQRQVVKMAQAEEKGVAMYKDSWSMAAQLMGEPNFIESLISMPVAVDTFSYETSELIQPYLALSVFSLEAAKKVSPFTAALYQWVAAIGRFVGLRDECRPRLQELEAKRKAMVDVQTVFDAVNEDYLAAQSDVDTMQAEFEETFAQKKRLQDEMESTKRRMVSATALLEAFADEKKRWTSEATHLEVQKQRVVGDCLIGAAFITFCGQLSISHRERILKYDAVVDLEARDLPVTGNLSLTKLLSHEAEIGSWRIQGLPNDEVSIQNGIIATLSVRWCLFLDPHRLAFKWVRAKEETAKVLSLSDKRFKGVLEDCLTYGKSLIIEHHSGPLSFRGSALENVANKNWIDSPKGRKVMVLDSEVPVDPGFDLCIVTKFENPVISPEMSTRLTVINFGVSKQALEVLLLHQVVNSEKSDLFVKRQKNVEEINSCMQKVRSLEEEMLSMLSGSTANLLEDLTLIDALGNKKKTWIDVQDRLKAANDVEYKLSSSYSDYHVIAQRGVLLFFLISDMSRISHMYHAGVSHLERILALSIETAPSDAVTSKRIASIIENFTLLAYESTVRGLREEHKEIFTVLLSIRIQQSQSLATDDHLHCLIHGGQGLNMDNVRRKPYGWVQDQAWLNCVGLFLKISWFKDLPDSIQRFGDQWRYWFEADNPESLPTPEITSCAKMTPLGTLLLLRAVRPDRVLIAVKAYTRSVLGDHFSHSSPLNLDAALAESTALTPIVCIITPGTELSDMVGALAKKLKKEVLNVSMGDSQNTVARKHVDTGVSIGSWVLLQNAHVSIPFLESLEDRMARLEDIEPEFRLWITTVDVPDFPLGILQSCIRVNNEAPRGIKASLKRSYAALSQDTIDAVGSPEWRMLLFITSFMHSVLQGRRHYGSFGWTRAYEWSVSDLTASLRVVQTILTESDLKTTKEKAKEMAWSPIRFLVGEIQYGGHVTDQWDSRLLRAYADKYFCQASIEPGYHLAKDFPVLSISDISLIRKDIDSFPDVDSAELFGLGIHHEVASNTDQVTEMLRTMGSAASDKAKGNSLGYQSGYEGLSKMCSDLLERLPIAFIQIDVKMAISKDGGASAPINVVLRQEVELLKAVFGKVKQTMEDVRASIAGHMVMTDEMLVDVRALYDSKLPPSWEKGAWRTGDSGLAGWLGNLMQRCEQWRLWVERGRPSCFWLAGFLRPRAFLNAVKQDAVKKRESWSLEETVLVTQVTKTDANDVKGPAEQGVFVHSVVLEGCGWHKRDTKLIDSTARTLHHPLPVLNIYPSVKKSKSSEHLVYETPMYADKRRTGPSLLTVELKTDEPPAKWTMRGVALLITRD